MDSKQLDYVRGRLVSTAPDPKTKELYNVLFDSVKQDPMGCLKGFQELLASGNIPDKDSAYMLGIIGGLGVALALDMGHRFEELSV